MHPQSASLWHVAAHTQANQDANGQEEDCLSLTILSGHGPPARVAGTEAGTARAVGRRPASDVDSLNKHVNALIPNERELRAIKFTLPAGAWSSTLSRKPANATR